ncbi:MAG: MBL fold metallo-hydrolase [Candidatus Thermoplasmatota archaeon]|nr:MBL fold metallo-hydrolase [Candidatus Thermoplasmatota archaeon]
MRLERLPGIHHDSACIVISGTESTVIIDSGTSWYQSNLVERLQPHLEGRAPVEAILLTHRHFDSCGAAPHLAQQFDATIKVHEDAVAPLAGGDLFTTWASRYDSDMPPIDAHGFADGDQISLGDATLHVLHTPGHTMDACCFHILEKETIICGDLVPAAGHPSRADMPTGNLIAMKKSLERVRDLSPNLLVCGRGEAISGSGACADVLNQHIESVEIRIEGEGKLPSGWPKPAETCHWLTPEPAWSFQ